MNQRTAHPPQSSARRGTARRRGGVLLMALVYMMLFAALATSMYAFSIGNMQVGRAEGQQQRALAAAESGMTYLLAQFKSVKMPTILEGSVADMSNPALTWYGLSLNGFAGNDGVAVKLARSINLCGAFATTGASAAVPTTTSPLVVPPIAVETGPNPATFALTVAWDSGNPFSVPNAPNTSQLVLHLKSVGSCNGIARTVTMDLLMQKTLKFAVYSNVAIQLGKNVHVHGDLASTFGGTSKGPPIQTFSDYHFLSDQSGLDTDLGKLRTLLATYDRTYTNRLDLSDPAVAQAAANAHLSDYNNDGVIDEYDLFLTHVDTSAPGPGQLASVTDVEYTDSATGKPYDAGLWQLINSPLGALDASGNLPSGSPAPWNGYGDNQIDQRDDIYKVNGNVKMAISQGTWNGAASGWSQWGDGGGTRIQDAFEGTIVAADPSVPAVQFGYDFSSEFYGASQITPQDFDTSGFNAQIPSSNATRTTSGSTTTISGGTLTSSMANGGTTTEHVPASVTSGWQATYKRPVFQNVVFNNVRIPKGLNAKFINCTFTGYTHVQLVTNITDSRGATTSDPNQGMSFAKSMRSGSFSANTTLTSSNSNGFNNGNALHFTNCTFNGVLTADTPSAYTHFANTWEFDGNTTVQNTANGAVTIEAPNTNMELGSYVNPAGNTVNLVGVVVAGNIDIRGTATVDGSLLVTGNGATNTTLGYFGSTDQGQGVPNPSQLPSAANGNYGHLYFHYNPNRGMPYGIRIPLTVLPQYSTYAIQ